MKSAIDVDALAREARKASRTLATASPDAKARALGRMADELRKSRKEILEANRADCAAARKAGRTSAYVDRMALDEARLARLDATIERVAALPDPVGKVSDYAARPTGLKVQKMRVPLGVVAVVFEARPGIAAEAAALCVKAGNSVLLRGEPESLATDTAVARALQEGLRLCGLPLGAVGLVRDPSPRTLERLLALEHWIDLVIPRGGHALSSLVREKSRIPVLTYEKGVCHLYVDEGADLAMAEAVCYNAKTQAPGAPNSLETLLVHEKAAPLLLPRLAQRYRRAGVELRGCPRTLALLPGTKPATVSDWDMEYLDLILSVKVVRSLQEAIQHIAHHGTGVAEGILTNDAVRAERFLREVDAGTVVVNASTRLADGEELGMGTELGFSAQKLHARGPIGLAELTCEKFLVRGSGQVKTERRG